MNEQGWGVDQDLSRAQHWYAEAAAQGDDEAIRKLRELGG
ncbi:MAG: SEL1-like repeat protein [Pseudomonadota bacterium]|jgi:TPR repeat protein|nr:SEL1-like repeat protein [Pseudomonadota bacterium]MEC8199468.1 SEL1-like repeat protein [Pseudomonadota bacterium]